MRFLKFIIFILLLFLLTIFTQIGGVILLLCYLLYRRHRGKILLSFSVIYLLSTFIIVPLIAPYFGREAIETTKAVKVHMFLTKLANRHYVVPQINRLLKDVSLDLRKENPQLEIHCLDANFPFWDGFPLLPHLSHRDGKKLDISLMYQDSNDGVVNEKPSRSGYGVFEKPTAQVYNQIDICKNKGYWQYDFPKYLTLGTTHKNLVMSAGVTKKMLSIILKDGEVSKVFIEPHLRDRMGITHPKLRYHGCKAVRHDDHIHIQVK